MTFKELLIFWERGKVPHWCRNPQSTYRYSRSSSINIEIDVHVVNHAVFTALSTRSIAIAIYGPIDHAVFTACQFDQFIAIEIDQVRKISKVSMVHSYR